MKSLKYLTDTETKRNSHYSTVILCCLANKWW